MIGLRRQLTYANVAVTLLGFVVLGGGAYAASGLGRSAVRTVNIARNAVTSPKVRDHSLTSQDFAQGQILGGSQGPPGPQGPQGETGVPGSARAYGLVSLSGALTRSKNITGVSNPLAGEYCVSLAAGINAAGTVAVVTPDFANDASDFGANQAQAIAEWRSDGLGCPTGTLVVITGMRTEVTNGTAVTDVHTTQVNQGFSIVVP